MNMNDILRTFPHTLATGDTFFFDHLCHTIFVQKNGIKFTVFYTFSTADTPILTLCFLICMA